MAVNLLLVFLGGGIGSMARYGLSQIVFKSNYSLPWATFIANMAACLVLAVVLYFSSQLQDWMRPLIVVGFCGGLSTFSTFSLETFELLNKGYNLAAVLNVCLSVAAGLSFFFLIKK